MYSSILSAKPNEKFEVLSFILELVTKSSYSFLIVFQFFKTHIFFVTINLFINKIIIGITRTSI